MAGHENRGIWRLWLLLLSLPAHPVQSSQVGNILTVFMP